MLIYIYHESKENFQAMPASRTCFTIIIYELK